MLTIHIIFAENLSSNLHQPKQQQGIKTQLIIMIGVRLQYQFPWTICRYYTGIYKPYNFALRTWNLKQQSITCLLWTALQACDILIFFLGKRASLYTTLKYPVLPCKLPKVCSLSAVALNLGSSSFFCWPLVQVTQAHCVCHIGKYREHMRRSLGLEIC